MHVSVQTKRPIYAFTDKCKVEEEKHVYTNTRILEYKDDFLQVICLSNPHLMNDRILSQFI